MSGDGAGDRGVRLTLAEWEAAGAERYGADREGWRFRCPSCGRVAAVRDWRAAGAPGGAIAFSCVGRYEATPAGVVRPCSYAGGGLFRLNPVGVGEAGEPEATVFDFADHPLCGPPAGS